MKSKMALIQREIKDLVITNLLNKVIAQEKTIAFLRTECEIYKINLLDTLKLLLTRNNMVHVKPLSSLSSPRRKSIEQLNAVTLSQGILTPSRQRCLVGNELSHQSIDSIHKKTIEFQAGEMLGSLSMRNERLTIDNDSGKMPRELFSRTNNTRLLNSQMKNSSQSRLTEKNAKLRSCSSGKKEVNKSNSVFASSTVKQRNKILDVVSSPNKLRQFNSLSMSTYQSKFNGKFLTKR